MIKIRYITLYSAGIVNCDYLLANQIKDIMKNNILFLTSSNNQVIIISEKLLKYLSEQKVPTQTGNQ